MDNAIHVSDRLLLTILLDAVWQLIYLLIAYIGHRYWKPSWQLCNTHVAKASSKEFTNYCFPGFSSPGNWNFEWNLDLNQIIPTWFGIQVSQEYVKFCANHPPLSWYMRMFILSDKWTEYNNIPSTGNTYKKILYNNLLHWKCINKILFKIRSIL